MRTLPIVALGALLLVAAPLSRAQSSIAKLPGDEGGARALLAMFLKPGADAAALTRQLRPSTADYKAVFSAELAQRAEAALAPAWEGSGLVIRPKEGQTETKLFGARTEDLRAGRDAAKEFPPGYARLAPHLKDGLVIYRFKFVQPGQELGMAYDGLVHVNGRWVIFPKPYRVLDAGKPEPAK